jgi:glycine cleavage system H lipoate-binding protein/ferredoxin
MISLTIDGKKIEIHEGATVLEAARKAGIWIPTLCYHEGLGSYQACRLCTVEVVQGESSRLQASCALPAKNGMEILTDSERVREGRRVIMELILARAPGVPKIQELAKKLGVTESPFLQKNDDCILCGLCVRVCSDIMGVGAIGFKGRGISKEVDTPFGEFSETCQACGACTYVCPTGKMQMEARQAENYRQLMGGDRQCRFVRMGFYSYKICPRNFQCWRCPVDQSMEELLETHPALASRPGEQGDIEQIFEFSFAPLFHYHKGHTWVQPINGKVRVGIDDFAARLVSPVTDLALPGLGQGFDQGSPAFELSSKDKKAELIFPLRGRVVDVNPSLADDPALAGRSPYHRGWIATVEPDNLRPDLTRLLHRRTARLWLNDEREKLFRFVGSESGGMVAADGGLLLENLPSRLDAPQWDSLVAAFFKA